MHDFLTSNSIVRILSFFASAIGPYVALMLALYLIIYHDKISKLKRILILFLLFISIVLGILGTINFYL